MARERGIKHCLQIDLRNDEGSLKGEWQGAGCPK